MPQDLAEGCLEQLTSSAVRVWVSLGFGLEVRIWVSAWRRRQIYRACLAAVQGSQQDSALAQALGIITAGQHQQQHGLTDRG